MDRFVAMQAFVRVADTGSFTKAAAVLDVPKPTVTRLVQGLEELLGVRLLHRTTRALQLTAEGAIYLEQCVRLLAELAEMEAGVQAPLAKPAGHIKVDVGVGMGTTVLVPALVDFQERYPEISVELGIRNTDADLLMDGVDCAIRVGEIADTSLVARRVGDFRFVTCATPAYLARHGMPRRPEDLLAGHRTVGLVSNRFDRVLPFWFGRGAQRFEIVPEHHLSLNDTNAYAAACAAGMGVIQVPNYAVHRQVRSGELVSLLEEWQPDALPISIVYRPNRFLTAKVRVFVDWLVELLAANEDLRRAM